MVMRIGCCCPSFQGELQKLSGQAGLSCFWPLKAVFHPFVPQVLSWRQRPCKLTREPLWPVKSSEKANVKGLVGQLPVRILLILLWVCFWGIKTSRCGSGVTQQRLHDCDNLWKTHSMRLVWLLCVNVFPRCLSCRVRLALLLREPTCLVSRAPSSTG